MRHRLLSLLPESTTSDIRRVLHRSRIRRHRWGAMGDPEFHILPELLAPGDWCIDVGANAGDYTLRMSELVGAAGRVIAVEPAPSAMEILASNVRASRYANVTLVGIAASDHCHVAHMQVPAWHGSALPNSCQAHIAEGETGLPILCMPLDSLAIEHVVRLVKVDAEGWDDHALAGMWGLIERDHPHLIVETVGERTLERLRALGYRAERASGSPNMLLRSPGALLASRAPAPTRATA